MAQVTEGLLNIRDASRFMKCSIATARRMAKRGDIPAVTLPGTRLLRFRPAALQRVIETSEKEKGSAA
jgi:predicted site-specific integrase-resolvase